MKSLSEEIASHLNRGEPDPHKIARSVLRKCETQWLVEQLGLEAILVDRIRRMLHIRRWEADREALDQLKQHDREERRLKRATAQKRTAAHREELDRMRKEMGLSSDLSDDEVVIAAMYRNAERFADSLMAEFVAELDMRHSVPGVGWKFRGQLTAQDCAALAKAYHDDGATSFAKAAIFRQAETELRQRRLENVGELASILTSDPAGSTRKEKEAA